jgi:plastocyanin
VKGVTALVSGYAFLALLAAPSVLVAADEEPVAPAEVVPAPPAPDPLQAAPPDAEQPAPAAETGSGGDVVEVPVAQKQASHEVAMRDIKFVPKKITVAVGDTITWRNEDPEPHNAIAEDDSFRTDTIQQGQTVSATISEAGSHPYFCSIHAGMTGTVVAGSGGGGGGGGGAGGGGGGGGSAGGSGSTGSSTASGTSTRGSSTTTTPGTGTGAGASGGTSSLPATGREELWFALAGAWLLTIGVLARGALAGDPR